jgi:hypothetical protein
MLVGGAITLLIVLGLVGIIGTTIDHWLLQDPSQTGTASGQVIEVRQGRDRADQVSFRYTDEAGVERRVTRDAAGDFTDGLAPGDPVRVRYLAASPEVAELEGGSIAGRKWLALLILLPMLCIFWALTAAMSRRVFGPVQVEGRWKAEPLPGADADDLGVAWVRVVSEGLTLRRVARTVGGWFDGPVVVQPIDDAGRHTGTAAGWAKRWREQGLEAREVAREAVLLPSDSAQRLRDMQKPGGVALQHVLLFPPVGDDDAERWLLDRLERASGDDSPSPLADTAVRRATDELLESLAVEEEPAAFERYVASLAAELWLDRPPESIQRTDWLSLMRDGEAGQQRPGAKALRLLLQRRRSWVRLWSIADGEDRARLMEWDVWGERWRPMGERRPPAALRGTWVAVLVLVMMSPVVLLVLALTPVIWVVERLFKPWERRDRRRRVARAAAAAEGGSSID